MSSQISSAAELFGSRPSAAWAMSSGPIEPPTSPSRSPKAASSSSSSYSNAVTSPSASFEMNTRSRMRMVSLSIRSARAGAIWPVNWFPGKPTMMYSIGPMAM